jgi:outer membrane protein OmpA-like peptidoglycan-associated protein
MPVNPPERKELRMLDLKFPRSLLLMPAVFLSLSTLVGCMQIPPELTTADQAIAKARQAGKDKECPDEFKAAEKLKDQAFAICKPCQERKAILLANESLKKTKELCPPKPTPVPTPVAVVPPPPPPPVAVSISASPASIKKGECTQLTWTSSNASSASIDQGIGKVDPSGSRKVCPAQTIEYRIAATGEAGSREASTKVIVDKVVDRLALHVNFDFNKATIRKVDDADLEKGATFVKKYPDFKISLEGHTDSIGSDKYNQKLSEKRAAAVKDYLVTKSVNGAKIQTSGFGKTRPIADNKTDAGRAENRRVEILILSE